MTLRTRSRISCLYFSTYDIIDHLKSIMFVDFGVGQDILEMASAALRGPDIGVPAGAKLKFVLHFKKI